MVRESIASLGCWNLWPLFIIVENIQWSMLKIYRINCCEFIIVRIASVTGFLSMPLGMILTELFVVKFNVNLYKFVCTESIGNNNS